MLKAVKKLLDRHYFDPAFGGVDIQAAFARAEKSMQEAQSAGHTFGIIAQALASLNDSHTYFIPPSRVASVQYGWKMRMIGDRCFVVGVRPGSDAANKSVKAGDEIGAIEGYRPTRENLWRMRLMYYALQPRPALKLGLRSPEGAERLVEVAASIKTGKQVIDLAGEHGNEEYYEMLREAQAEAAIDPHSQQSIGKEMLIYRMPNFGLSDDEVDRALGNAKGYERLILDLRGNGGGAVTTLERVAGHLLGKDVPLAERKGRKQEKPIKARAAGSAPISSRLAVLVDSDSGSASEILARAVQLEKRGVVIGDRTAGAVRQSLQYSEKVGMDRVVFFGVSITNADLIMKDGKSVEHSGVIPDETILPPAADLAAGRDPVLARAAEFLGVTLSPEAAGKLFPVKWRN